MFLVRSVFEGFWNCFLMRVVREKERPGCTAVSSHVLGVLPSSPHALFLRAGFDLHGKFGIISGYIFFFLQLQQYLEGVALRERTFCVWTSLSVFPPLINGSVSNPPPILCNASQIQLVGSCFSSSLASLAWLPFRFHYLQKAKIRDVTWSIGESRVPSGQCPRDSFF